MNYEEFLDQAINEGIKAAKSDYTDPKDKDRLDGSIAGFEACRKKNPTDLADVFQKASEDMNKAQIEQKDNYWWYACFQSEVEWICNVVSAMLVSQGHQSLLSYLPTYRGAMKAAEIIGTTQHA